MAGWGWWGLLAWVFDGFEIDVIQWDVKVSAYVEPR